MPVSLSGKTDEGTGPDRTDRAGRAAAEPAKWWSWRRGCGRRHAIGVQAEVMPLQRSTHSLVHASEAGLAQLSGALDGHASPETHASVIELVTGVHIDIASAVAELSALRARIAHELRAMGMEPASAGTYPLASSAEPRVFASPRYRAIERSMRSLVHREPTMALHVHVGVPDAEDAIRVMNRLRGNLPILLALSANSPYCNGRDSGFASLRTLIFQGFPRTGPPRLFADYADYVGTVDPLIASGAIVAPSYLWWDVRLQPALGTVEVRAMDVQASVLDTAPLVALIQCLARLELEGAAPPCDIQPELLAENRFLAARDGLDARLIDPFAQRLVPVRALIDDLLVSCTPHAVELNCFPELDGVSELPIVNGADQHRTWPRDVGPAEMVGELGKA